MEQEIKPSELLDAKSAWLEEAGPKGWYFLHQLALLW